MERGHAGGFDYQLHMGTDGVDAPCVFLPSVAQSPFDASTMLAGLECNVAVLPIANWDDDMTPWRAPGLYAGDPDFEGHAAATLARIMDELLPHLERAHGLAPRALGIAGYSLGGLFALWSFLNDARFAAVASMSGSVWYTGWLDYLDSLDDAHRPLDGHFAYLSIGNKERKAREKILHCVEENTVKTAHVLESWGMQVEYQLNQGTHYDHVSERVAMGLRALDAHL